MRRMTFFDRVKISLLAFRHAKTVPYFAVIYDSLEFAERDDDEGDYRIDPVESYYERFGSVEEARMIFRSAFPIEREMTVEGSERLVLVLGPIDAYRKDIL